MKLFFEEIRVDDLTVYSDSKTAFLEIIVNKNNQEYLGLGEFGGKDVDIVLELFFRRFVPAIIGQHFTSPLELLDKVVSFELNYKMMGVQFSKALCAIDSALWDVFAKIEDKSVSELISSKTPKPIPVYASSIKRGLSQEFMLSELQRIRQTHGITAFKVKVGVRMRQADQVQDEDIAKLEYLLRNMKDCRIAIDCNGAYKSDTIFGPFSSLKCGKLWFIEEPLHWFRYQDYKVVSHKLKTEFCMLLAGGEQEFRRDVWTEVAKLFDIAQPDFGYSGGFTELILISKYHKHIYPHSPQNGLMPIMSWHFLNASEQDEKFLELGCVNDGLIQVKLDSNGCYKPEYFNETMKVENGKFLLMTNTHGWGVSLDPTWKSKAVKRKYNISDKELRTGL